MDVEISISLSLLINKLQDLLGDPMLKREWCQRQIRTAITNLHSLNQFLKDLEASSSGGSANDPRASQLLKAVYSAEDATDTFLLTKKLQHFEYGREPDQSYTQKMKFFCSHKKKAPYPFRFAEKMKKFNEEVRSLVEKKGAETSDVENSNNTRFFRFQNDRDHLRHRQHWGKISDFCLEEETHVVGLQQQINELVVRLIPQLICNNGQSSGGNKIKVLDVQEHRVVSTEVMAVVGQGGSGKTTLARSVYNRIDVKRHFTIRAWVRIPSVFKPRDVLVDLLAQINQHEFVDATLSIDGLIRRLTKVLKRTRFLIVLDDVETLLVWKYLVSALSFSSPEGGKIIIIVRSTDYLPPNVHYSTLNICKLNHDESWKLFSNKVRIAEEELNNNSELITLKEQILNICGGLPLTIVLLGGLLSTKEKSCDEWLRVLTNKSTSEGILALSYQDLPPEVKPCFLHMGLFPKRFEIPVRRLIHLWCAEGFVATPVPEEIDPENVADPEDVAEMCMEELVTRNMVQVIRWRAEGSPKTCCIPNVLYDFFSSKAANVGFLHHHFQSSQTLPEQQEFSFRRLVANAEINYLPSSLGCIQKTRSYVAFDTRVPITPAMAIYEFLHRITGKRGFGLLRVLDLEGVYRPFLSSDQIGRLFLLTYLSLRSTSIDDLPKWVTHMPYLETLDVKHTNITRVELKSRYTKTGMLRHLYLNQSLKSFQLPDSTNLRTLKGLNNKCRGFNVFRMTRLTKLGLIWDSYPSLENEPGINELTELQSLKLKLINSAGDVSCIELRSLAVHHRLQELYLLAKLPESIINVGFLPPNLRKLTLSLSELEEDPMPVLGKLPHLNILRLLSTSYIGEEMTCLSTGFPKLHLLKLWELPVRVWTVEEGAMPCLRELEIRKCVSLELPQQQGLENVTALKELVLTNMPTHFVAAVEKSLQGRDVYITNNSWKSDPFPEQTMENSVLLRRRRKPSNKVKSIFGNAQFRREKIIGLHR